MDLLRHLRYFVAVAEELHFGRAADRLHMAQSPLSQRIRSLERELDVQLFVRSSRRVTLTPAGRVLLDESRELLRRADDLRTLMHQVRDGSLGELRAALLPDLRAAVLAGVVRAFRAAAPHVRLDLREAPTADQARALRDGSLDVGLLQHPVLDPALATGPVLEKPLGALVQDGGELSAQAELDLGAFGDRPLVLFPRQAAPEAYDEVLATCRAYGYVPSDVHEAPRHEFAVGLVMTGDAVALTEAPDAPAEGVRWRPLAGRPLRVSVSTAWRAGEAAGAIGAYTDAAIEVLCEHGGWERAAAPEPVPSGPPRVTLRPSSGPLS